MWNLWRSCSCPVLSRCNCCSSFSLSMICRTCLHWLQAGRFVLNKNLKSCLNMVTLAQVLGAFTPVSWITWIFDQDVYGFHVFLYPLLWQGEGESKVLEHLSFCGLGAWQWPQAPLLLKGRLRFPPASAAHTLSAPSKEVSLACSSWLFQ